MPRYRVTLRRTTVEIVEAANPFQAAIVASRLSGEGVEVDNVTPALGRPAASIGTRKLSRAAQKSVKKRRPLSPEARAKLAQNLVKARAARAAKAKAAKKTTRTGATKKKPPRTAKNR